MKTFFYLLTIVVILTSLVLCSGLTATTSRPQLGGSRIQNTDLRVLNSRPKISQNDFIQHEQNYGQPFSSTTNKPLIRQDTFVVNPKPENFPKLGTTGQNGKGSLVRQDTFVVQPNSHMGGTTKRPLNRQDTFIISPKPTGIPVDGTTNAWSKGNPFATTSGKTYSMGVAGNMGSTPGRPTSMTTFHGGNSGNMDSAVGRPTSMTTFQGGNSVNMGSAPGRPTSMVSLADIGIIPGKPTSMTPSQGKSTPGKPTSMVPLPTSQTPTTKNAWNKGNPFGTSPSSPTSGKTTGIPQPQPTLSTNNIGTSTIYTPPVGNMNEDDELRDFAENLLKKDNNNAAKYVTINFQKMTTSRSMMDEAPLPLLYINDTVSTIPSISKLMLLYNNYILETNMNEVYTAQEKLEEGDFLDTILQTPVMQYSRNFLIKKGKLGKDPKDFKTLLRQIWFNMYSRGGGKIGSSGFEHVFLGELKGTDVSGLHNWLYFNSQELKNQANYLGYLKKIDLGEKGAILKHHFTFHGVDKPVGSMFIGTSPELEIALYSTCFILRPDRVCPLKMNGNRFTIRTFTFRYRGKNMIGSAFPDI